MNILIIRSAPMDVVNEVIEYLKSKFAEAKISILAQPEVKEELEKDSRVYEVIIYDKGFFNVFKIGYGLLNNLKKKMFDLIVILYNNPTGRSYFHPEAISFLICPKNIFVYDTNGSYYRLRFLIWFYKIIGRIFSYTIIGFLFVFIFLLWILNKALNKAKKLVVLRRGK